MFHPKRHRLCTDGAAFLIYSIPVENLAIVTYDDLMMKPTKMLAITGLAILAGTGMTACSSPTEAEVNTATHRVIQGETEGFSWTWEYIDSTGNHVEMNECEDRGFWSKSCVETADGLVRFEHSSYKSSITEQAIFYDGVELETKCAYTEGFWNSKHLCGAGSN